MSTFVIFGATGAVGGFLLPRLLASGATVRAVSRHPPGAGAPNPRWTRGDLFGEIPPLPAADAIVSLGPLDAFAAWFERGVPESVRRVIALGSMSATTKAQSPDADERALAARLQAAERRLVQAADARGIAWTLFRPTLIYGAGSDRSLAPIARFARRWRVLPLPLAATGLRQPVHADDLARAVVAAIDCPATFGKIYALGGGERLPFGQMLWRLRGALPGFVLPLPLPSIVLRAAARVAGRSFAQIGGGALRRLREPLIADHRDAARDFGYSPRAFIAADVLGPGASRPIA